MKWLVAAVFLALGSTAMAADQQVDVKVEPWPTACISKAIWEGNVEEAGYKTIWSHPDATGDFLISYIESDKQHVWAVIAEPAKFAYVCTLTMGFIDWEDM